MSTPLFHHSLAIPVSDRDHSQGLASAPVTLVLYGDFQCPFTAALHLTTTKLQTRFGDSIRYVFRHFPLFTKHPLAQLCAETAEAASAQNKFWDMYAYLFQTQYDFTRDRLPAACKLLGLDYARLDREISEHTHLPRINEDVAGAKRSGVASTPTLFINALMYDASDDFETLSRHIESLFPAKTDAKNAGLWRGLFGTH